MWNMLGNGGGRGGGGTGTGAAQVTTEEMPQMSADRPQSDMCVTNPGNVQGGKTT
jgi:hypothetical protein